MHIKTLILTIIILIHTAIPQEKSVSIFDPFDEYRYEFIDSLQTLFDGSITIIDSLAEETVAGKDALFLFLHIRNKPLNSSEYFLSLKECELLDKYLHQGRNLHLFSEMAIQEFLNPIWDTATFFENIGISMASANLISCATDTAQGMPGTFMENEKFTLRKDEIGRDTTYYGIFNANTPWIEGECVRLLISDTLFKGFSISYMYERDNYRVIIDQFYVISERPYLRKVCEYFDLIPVNINSEYTEKTTLSVPDDILIKHTGNRVFFEAPHMKTAQVTIFDLKGKTLLNRLVKPGEPILLTDFLNGTFIVKVKSNNYTYTNKIYIIH